MRKSFACLTGGLLLLITPLWSQPLGIEKGEKLRTDMELLAECLGDFSRIEAGCAIKLRSG